MTTNLSPPATVAQATTGLEPMPMSRGMVPTSRVLVTVATYNEMENLPRLVEEIQAAVEGVDILVIDDNSPDGTGRWCDQVASEQPYLHCLHRPGKLGLGTATVAAMRYAIEHDYDVMVNMDADFSHHPRHLSALLAGMRGGEQGGEVDVMIGSRYVLGGRIEGWPLRRHLMSRAVNFYARWMLGLSPRDCSGAYRAYRVSCLARLDFEAIRSKGYSFQEEILLKLKQHGATFGETPITFADRERGSSKIDMREARQALYMIGALGLERCCGRGQPTTGAPKD